MRFGPLAMVLHVWKIGHAGEKFGLSKSLHVTWAKTSVAAARFEFAFKYSER